MDTAPYFIGITSQQSEVHDVQLPVTGSIPAWLDGTLVRTGPAKFEIGDRRLDHLFDGFAMLHAYRFADGHVTYTNQALRGKAYREAHATGWVTRGEFATGPHWSLATRLYRMLRPSYTDNCCVNVARFGDRMVAMTETPLAAAVDAHTLVMQENYRLDQGVPGHIACAHPQFDAQRNCYFSFLVKCGLGGTYNFYRVDADTGAHAPVAAVTVKEPAYVHSFGMTEQYLVLTEFPLVAKPLSFPLSGKPYIENYRWEPERGTRFHVIEKDSGRVLATARGAANFTFHCANAFEDDGAVVVDLAAYPDPTIIEHLYLDYLASGQTVEAVGKLTRFRVPLRGGDVAAHTQLADTCLEFPRINEARCTGRRYRYVYGAGSEAGLGFTDNLVKIDLQTGAACKWHEPGCYPGEPVFVPAPGAEDEDAGVVLAMVLDTRNQVSFLLMLDGRSYAEAGRAVLPHHVPFGFHGQFFAATAQS
jgi:carotenoid cleavage dioxygenase-like enzyme